MHGSAACCLERLRGLCSTSTYSTSQIICRTLVERLSGLCTTPAHGMFSTASKTLVCLLLVLGGVISSSKAPGIVSVTAGDALPLAI